MNETSALRPQPQGTLAVYGICWADGIQEVSGSIPLISTIKKPWKPCVPKDFFALGGNRAQRGGNWPTTFLTTLTDLDRKIMDKSAFFSKAFSLLDIMYLSRFWEGLWWNILILLITLK